MAFPHGHRKTTTLVTGLHLDGMVAPMVLDGPINSNYRGLCRPSPCCRRFVPATPWAWTNSQATKRALIKAMDGLLKAQGPAAKSGRKRSLLDPEQSSYRSRAARPLTPLSRNLRWQGAAVDEFLRTRFTSQLMAGAEQDADYARRWPTVIVVRGTSLQKLVDLRPLGLDTR